MCCEGAGVERARQDRIDVLISQYAEEVTLFFTKYLQEENFYLLDMFQS